MNDLGYGQLSNPNRSLKLVLMRVEIIENSFFDISTTLVKDFIASHSLSQSPQIGGAFFKEIGISNRGSSFEK